MKIPNFSFINKFFSFFSYDIGIDLGAVPIQPSRRISCLTSSRPSREPVLRGRCTGDSRWPADSSLHLLC